MALPYEPDDDHAADRFVNNALRSRDPEVWRQLASEAYVEQTDRVLLGMLDRIAVDRAHRKAERDTARARLSAGEISRADHDRDLAEEGERTKKTAHFEALVREQHRLIASQVRRLRGDDVRDELMSLVIALGAAIDTHRAAVLGEGAEPTEADRALWARLTTLDVPGTTGATSRTSLEALVEQHTAQQDDHGRTLAAIILDLAGDATSVARADLLDVWKKKVAPTLTPEEKADFAAKGKGSLVTERLRKAMGVLERRGLVARSGAQGDQRLDVLDRAGLVDLAAARP
ncbi:hypothetical protein FHS29_005174 [Saccharothrix tamanrassetensis]|uniref:Uncharacterized protein n=1 Tax=Saccharothrix tamanrassetensis TaxID=1051531 RepID=A0A841CT08_9PSEU|nr:hypothetical protein [Saccharothrix tamanrassetensis]MBB5958566.1 hypothetical protein [Saccharothrix tamanrassetensis]